MILVPGDGSRAQRALYFRITRSFIRRPPGKCSLEVVQLKSTQLCDGQI